MMLYVTIELSIKITADVEAITDAVFDHVCAGEWLIGTPLEDQVISVDGATCQQAFFPRKIETRG